MMDFMGFLWWPFLAAGAVVGFIIGALIFAFWLWMIVDCAQRKFKNDAEKIVWIVVIALLSWIGALVYYITIKSINPRGISR